MKKLYSNKLVILSLVLLGLLLFVFAILAPICLSVYYGFTDYSGIGSWNFVGMENYKKLITKADPTAICRECRGDWHEPEADS